MNQPILATRPPQSWLRALAAFALVLTHQPAARAQSEPTATQVIELRAGWNLISIQVGSGITPAQFQAALGADAGKLRAIWGFGSAAAPGSAPWQWQFHRTDVGHPNDLLLLEPGQGYWVDVAGYCQATLNGAPSNGAVSFDAGWNLVGFNGLHRAESEIQQLPDVFGAAFDRITQVWKWDTATQRWSGYDLTAIPQVNDLDGVEAGCGYWVYALEPVTLTPQPYIALPADSDASPPQPAEDFAAADPRFLGADPAPYVGGEVRFRNSDGSDDAYDLNANGVLDDAYTQDTILFEKASEAIPVTIANAGGGTLTWSLENSVDWLFTAPEDERLWPDGATTRPRLADGTVSSEKDTLILYADRTGMTPGQKSGDSVTLWVGGVAHFIHLLIDVPEIDGDWTGFATTSRVGGKEISLGEVRLALNAFRPDPDGAPSAFRAVLNREQAILFPRDVYMDGIFFNGEQFKLTTNFSMPAGDRNAPPYNTFSHTTPGTFPGDPQAQTKAARGDKDFDGDGVADTMNPFPFGLRREVTLIGRRVSPNRLEGSYIEAIRGMLPPVVGNDLPGIEEKFYGDGFLTESQPVFIEGTFVLTRESFEPSQRSVFNETAEPEVPIGGSGSGSRTEILSVGTSATVQSVVVEIDLDLANVDPALLRITLFSPAGTFHTLHDFDDQFVGSYTLDREVFQGEDTAGDWQLQIEWEDTSGERATLHSWSLNIEGASTHSVSGRIVRAGTLTPEPEVAIRIEGAVTTLSTDSAADGTFVFPELTENDYTLVITRPGFQPANVLFFVGEEDVDLGDIELTPLTVTAPEIRGAPLLGFEPQYVDLQMLVPTDYGATQISWNFGDGSPAVAGDFAELVAPAHTYENAGLFTPVATLSGGALGAPVVITGPVVHVHRRKADPGFGGPSNPQVVAVHFVGAMAARMDASANVPEADPFSRLDEQSQFTDENGTVDIDSATFYQESQWDSASFDLDRFPLGTGSWAVSAGLEDSDYGRSGDLASGGQTFIFYNTSAVDNQTTPHDEKWDARAWSQIGLPPLPPGPLYQSPGTFETYTPANPDRPIRLRVGVTMGGYLLGKETLPMGDVNLLPGRTLR